jgi:hypothetical protein
MKYTTKAAEKSTVKVTIKFDGEEWKEAQNKAYLKLRNKFAINGFRKGKAPKHVIENVYGKGVFYEDALNLLFSENYPAIVEKVSAKYTIVGEPDVTIDKFEEDLVSLIATVPVKPEAKISAYTGMKIQEYAYTVKDEDVEAEVQRLLERQARQEEVEGRPAKAGDIANIDFLGSVDGVPFEGGEAQGDQSDGCGQKQRVGQNGVPIGENQVYIVEADAGVDEKDHRAKQCRKACEIIEKRLLNKYGGHERPAGNRAPWLRQDDPQRSKTFHFRLMQPVQLHGVHKADRNLEKSDGTHKGVHDPVLCSFRILCPLDDEVKEKDQRYAGEHYGNMQNAPLSCLKRIFNAAK